MSTHPQENVAVMALADALIQWCNNAHRILDGQDADSESAEPALPLLSVQAAVRDMKGRLFQLAWRAEKQRLGLGNVDDMRLDEQSVKRTFVDAPDLPFGSIRDHLQAFAATADDIALQSILSDARRAHWRNRTKVAGNRLVSLHLPRDGWDPTRISGWYRDALIALDKLGDIVANGAPPSRASACLLTQRYDPYSRDPQGIDGRMEFGFGPFVWAQCYRNGRFDLGFGRAEHAEQFLALLSHCLGAKDPTVSATPQQCPSGHSCAKEQTP